MDIDSASSATDAILTAARHANAAVGMGTMNPAEDGKGREDGSGEGEEEGPQNTWTEGDEEATFSVFHELLSHLPEKMKYNLLLKALKSCGPGCLEGIEEARDAILYSASRRNPALLKDVVSWLDGGEEPGDDEDEDDEGNGDGGGDEEEDEEEGKEDARRRYQAAAASLSSSVALPPSSSGAAAGAGAGAGGSGWNKGFLLGNGGAGSNNTIGRPLPGSDVDMQAFLKAVGAATSSSSSSSSSSALPAGFYGGTSSVALEHYLAGAPPDQRAMLQAAMRAQGGVAAGLMAARDEIAVKAENGEEEAAGEATAGAPTAASAPKPLLPSMDDDNDEDDQNGHGGFGL